MTITDRWGIDVVARGKDTNQNQMQYQMIQKWSPPGNKYETLVWDFHCNWQGCNDFRKVWL